MDDVEWKKVVVTRSGTPDAVEIVKFEALKKDKDGISLLANRWLYTGAELLEWNRRADESYKEKVVRELSIDMNRELSPLCKECAHAQINVEEVPDIPQAKTSLRMIAKCSRRNCMHFEDPRISNPSLEPTSRDEHSADGLRYYITNGEVPFYKITGAVASYTPPYERPRSLDEFLTDKSEVTGSW